MGFVQILGLGLIVTMAIVLLKQSRPELAVLIGIAGGVAIIILVMDELFTVVYAFYELAEQTGLSDGIFKSVLKIIGIGYLAEFSANICLDAGSKSVGEKILFAAKVIIMISALPILQSLVDVIASLLQMT
ncbi:MAG: SpoIIIAC/SpoIIIAD family protein [Clostridia bacterium]|nr:SpoIIIAC/SpoIIIAD family protein [Clostridia bacterium]